MTPALALEAAEDAALKTTVNQEPRVLKNIESLESGALSTTESTLAKENPLEKALEKSKKIIGTDQALLESIKLCNRCFSFGIKTSHSSN